MQSNIERYKKDIEELIQQGAQLGASMMVQCGGENYETVLNRIGREALENLPSFNRHYQSWYSESKGLIKQLLPDRLSDFTRLYEKPKGRAIIVSDNYSIEDFIQGNQRLLEGKVVAGRRDAINLFHQQLSILEAVRRRFESSLLEIRQLVQADLFDSELGAARELLKNKYFRSAGALAGVVLERHLADVCQIRAFPIAKSKPTIATLNDKLKEENVIDIATWRFVQHLADIRNACDHARTSEPSSEQISDLISGVERITKTVL